MPVVVDFLGAPKVAGAYAPRVELILGLMVLLSLSLSLFLSRLSLRPNFGKAGFGMPVLLAT